MHSGGGTFTAIDNPNGFFGTVPFDINPQGEIAGFYVDDNLVEHGFLWRDGVFTAIDDPKAGNGPITGTEPAGISASGDIVGGYIENDGAIHGFRYRDGEFTTIDDPVGRGTDVHNIAHNGDMVGDYFDSAFGIHGFLFDGHKYTTIDLPGAPHGAHCGTDASAIEAQRFISKYKNNKQGAPAIGAPSLSTVG